MIEKPFGTDLASARDLNAQILSYASEPQIYRIDHFLGKDTVQSIRAVRFANALFEPMWRRGVHRSRADHGGRDDRRGRARAGFYEQTGAFRDMVPKPPVPAARHDRDGAAEFVRRGDGARQEGRSVRRDPAARRTRRGVRAVRKGTAGPGYREEPDVAPDSGTETYAAARVHIDNWRWAGVPFYVRTGKRLAARRTELSRATEGSAVPAVPRHARRQADAQRAHAAHRSVRTARRSIST